MDPLENIQMEKDTSFILMLGAHKRGHKVYYLPKGGCVLKNGSVHFHATEVVPQLVKGKPFVVEKPVVLNEKEVDTVFIRTDPPFDYDYLMHTWILDRLSHRVVVVNDPAGIRTANEKIWATQFTGIVPPAIVTRNREELLWFIDEHKKVIAKPTDGYGGQSVFCIQKGELNCDVILETLTNNFKKDIILQKFIEEADQGDKRILVLDGEPLAAVLRLHKEGDHRNNFFSGGKPIEADITKRDKKIIKVIKPELKKLGLHFVGIDLLGDYLIEINVTSPACLQEMNRFYHKNLEDQVIAFVEGLVRRRR